MLIRSKQVSKIFIINEANNVVTDRRVTYNKHSIQVGEDLTIWINETYSHLFNIRVKVNKDYDYISSCLIRTQQDADKRAKDLIEEALAILDKNNSKNFSDVQVFKELESYLVTHDFAYIMKVADLGSPF